MFAVRACLFVVAVLAYVATTVGLYVRATDHGHAAPNHIERTGPDVTPPRVSPQRKKAEDYFPGPASFAKEELADLRSSLRDQPSGLGK